MPRSVADCQSPRGILSKPVLSQMLYEPPLFATAPSLNFDQYGIPDGSVASDTGRALQPWGWLKSGGLSIPPSIGWNGAPTKRRTIRTIAPRCHGRIYFTPHWAMARTPLTGLMPNARSCCRRGSRTFNSAIAIPSPAPSAARSIWTTFL